VTSEFNDSKKVLSTFGALDQDSVEVTISEFARAQSQESARQIFWFCVRSEGTAQANTLPNEITSEVT